MAGLYLPQGGGFWEKGQQHARVALGAYGSQIPERSSEITPPGKTVGGALSAGAGYGAAGYVLGGATALGGPAGAAIGAGVGLLGYFLS